MTIIVRRTTGEAFEVSAGRHRLMAALQVFGKAAVTDAETGETFEVHEVEGRIVALQRPGEASAETEAARAIVHAART
ncbi:hypothetical protein [Paucibacter soli]|uniref:hypothetical protein n=1 Tax=Paucibacter soli TaxID=3133433 RepID=UPI0030A5BD19